MKPIDLDSLQENLKVGYGRDLSTERATALIQLDIARSLRKLVESKNETGMAPKDAR